MIEFKEVDKFYRNGVQALSDITMSIEAGDFVSIVGQSGTGKTTIARLIIAEEN